jgi:hypothetical protein
VSLTPLVPGPRIREALAAFKGNINKKKYLGQLYYPTAGAEIGDLIVEYLREFEAICKKALTR